jgi:hypothetical protein
VPMRRRTMFRHRELDRACGPNFRARAQRMNKAAEYRKSSSEARERVAQSFSNYYCDHWTDVAYFWAELAAVEECLWPEALGMPAPGQSGAP